MVEQANPMRETIKLSKQEFEIGMMNRSEFEEIYNAFKEEFGKLLNGRLLGLKIGISSLNIYGFFQLRDTRIYYFNIWNVRYEPGPLQFRIGIADSFEDYDAELTHRIPLDENFKQNLFKLLKIQ